MMTKAGQAKKQAKKDEGTKKNSRYVLLFFILSFIFLTDHVWVCRRTATQQQKKS